MFLAGAGICCSISPDTRSVVSVSILAILLRFFQEVPSQTMRQITGPSLQKKTATAAQFQVPRVHLFRFSTLYVCMSVYIQNYSHYLFSAVGRVVFFHTDCFFLNGCFQTWEPFLFKRHAGCGTPFVFKRHRWVWDTVRFQTPPLDVGHRSFPNATAGCGTPFVFKRHRWV